MPHPRSTLYFGILKTRQYVGWLRRRLRSTLPEWLQAMPLDVLKYVNILWLVFPTLAALVEPERYFSADIHAFRKGDYIRPSRGELISQLMTLIAVILSVLGINLAPIYVWIGLLVIVFTAPVWCTLILALMVVFARSTYPGGMTFSSIQGLWRNPLYSAILNRNFYLGYSWKKFYVALWHFLPPALLLAAAVLALPFVGFLASEASRSSALQQLYLVAGFILGFGLVPVFFARMYLFFAFSSSADPYAWPIRQALQTLDCALEETYGRTSLKDRARFNQQWKNICRLLNKQERDSKRIGDAQLEALLRNRQNMRLLNIDTYLDGVLTEDAIETIKNMRHGRRISLTGCDKTS
jgi:hypothetical protein